MDILPDQPKPLLEWALSSFGSGFVLTTSFQREGMVLLDMAVKIDSRVRVATLDTGRLPAETYEMIETVRKRYGIAVEMVSPEAGELAAMTEQHGPNLFYQSMAHRKLCCQVRKVLPLERLLGDAKAYATGLRREQAESRQETEVVSRDGAGRYKLAPLAAWTQQQVSEYLAANQVPEHPLYGKGYTSIGCAPCSRAVAPGEGERAGRWWWEDEAQKECGLHVTPSGQIRRELDILLEQVLQKGGK